MVVRARMVRTNGLEFGVLEAGEGPLAVCLHGFPDSAHTWRHLQPALAEAGFHAVALHHALDGDGDAVLIGHEWGAEAANGAAAFAPDRWRRVVTLGVPPLALDPVLYSDYQQLKRFFYLFWSRDSLAPAAEVVAASHQAQQPTLYLHGSLDGCIGVEPVRGAERHLAPGSRMIVVEGAGHFPHLEQPEEVNEHILAWGHRLGCSRLATDLGRMRVVGETGSGQGFRPAPRPRAGRWRWGGVCGGRRSGVAGRACGRGRGS